MGKLCVKQAHDVAPRSEGARLSVHPVLTSELRDEVRRYQLDDLAQNGGVAVVWLGGLL